MSNSEDRQVISDEKLKPLNHRQRTIYSNNLAQFADYLEEEGRDPKKGIGYAEKSVPTIISRFHRLMKWIWANETEGIATELTPDLADTVVTAMDEDSIRRMDGDRYEEGSKRKMNDVLRSWFDYRNVDWEPETEFSDEAATNNADPFTKSELQQLWQASLDYKSIPRYNNLSPDERERWKSHVAQELGKPKEEVVPADWKRINRSWKVPSIIRTTREAAWRPDLIARMEVDWYNPSTQTFEIPAGEAPKNDVAWDQQITDEAALSVEEWKKQRENIPLYDGRPELWLNREGNPYSSGSLNNMLDNLMEAAGIPSQGRKLVWYSFRHSLGTYVHDEYKDLALVAEKLRQKSRASAERYVHPRPELKLEAAEIM